LPALSALRPILSKYFKQIVAVVTNPPIDPIREGTAFDLGVHLGAAPAVHENVPVYDPLPQYLLPSPVLTEEQLSRIQGGGADRPVVLMLDATFSDPQTSEVAGAKALSRRIAELGAQALESVRRGAAQILILSDRRVARPAEPDDPAPAPLPLPMILLT